jgi:CBS domain-containing protein
MERGIGNSCVRTVATVTKDSTVAHAATLMRKHHIGALVMVDDSNGANKPVGMVTDRDIAIEVVAAGLAPETVKIGEIVQRPIATVSEDADWAETARLMSVNGVRRMPVVDAAGRLIGIVSFDDLLLQVVGPLVAIADLAGRERHFEATTRG